MTIDFNAQEDPAMLLLVNVSNSVNDESLMQASMGRIVEGVSQGATNSTKGGDNLLSDIASYMETLTASSDSSKLTTEQSLYQVQQTIMSNKGNNYTNAMNAGSTAITDSSSQQAQTLQTAMATPEFMDAVNQMLMSLGS